MTEILGHLRIGAQAIKILETCTCIPCMMPFITSQFLRRTKGDRPQVSAGALEEPRLRRPILRTARRRGVYRGVFDPLGANGGLFVAWARATPPPVYQGKYDTRVLLKAFLALHDLPVHT